MSIPHSPRTDLACETAAATLPRRPGLRTVEQEEDGITTAELIIEDEETARLLDRPCGRYLTLSRPRLWVETGEGYARFRDRLAAAIRTFAAAMTGRAPDRALTVLVVGLGNRDITADAIGPLTVSKLSVTRHLRDHAPTVYTALGRCSLAALAPGVLGQTGIEAVELIRGAVEASRPDLVIAIDALAARSCRRLATTVQLCDRGIAPGSGVGNHRLAINEASVGVPVLALGVPTVVDSATLVYDALAQAGIGEISDALRAVLEEGRSFIVTPSESDVIAASVSSLLADAIECALAV